VKVFVDANVFLRFLVEDDLQQARQAEALFNAAKAGKTELYCGPPVLFEVAWTLRGSYGQSRLQVLDVLRSLLAFPGLKMLDKDLVTKALDLAQAHGMEFADAYIAATALGAGIKLTTFNLKDFKACGVQLRPWAA
jgi:predicted nucleic acid-binding protein